MADTSIIVDISLTKTPKLATFDNANACMLVTSETGFLSSNKRYALYRNLAAVATDFGTHSDTYEYAASFFATSPNPTNADGYLLIGFWRAVDEDVPASAASLVGAQISAAATLPNLQKINDGSFTITIDGTEISVTGLDFRASATMQDAVGLINENATFTPLATCTLVDESVVIKSKTTGATSTLTVMSAATSGTFVGTMLKLSEGSGNTLTQGAAASTLTAETKLAAITALRAQVYFLGSMFIDKPTDTEVTSLSTWAQANKVIMYDVFSETSNFDVDVTNPVWLVTLGSKTNYRCLMSKANNRKLASSYMARMHTVLFAGQNTAITMNLKSLSVPSEDYTDTEIFKAEQVGLALYTTIKDLPVILDSGANDYVDNVYNLLAMVNEVEIDTFNLLRGTNTKIPQTTKGVSQIVTTIEETLQRFVRNGTLAPGTWKSSDTFGNLAVFKRAIEQKGYFVLAGLLKDQPLSERQERKSPVIQAAAKLAGAVEHVDVIINVED